jgi:hypothetical protein
MITIRAYQVSYQNAMIRRKTARRRKTMMMLRNMANLRTLDIVMMMKKNPILLVRDSEKGIVEDAQDDARTVNVQKKVSMSMRKKSVKKNVEA